MAIIKINNENSAELESWIKANRIQAEIEVKVLAAFNLVKGSGLRFNYVREWKSKLPKSLIEQRTGRYKFKRRADAFEARLRFG